jgi:hypothetical protein
LTEVGLARKPEMSGGVVNSGFTASDSNLKAKKMKARTYKTAHTEIA